MVAQRCASVVVAVVVVVLCWLVVGGPRRICWAAQTQMVGGPRRKWWAGLGADGGRPLRVSESWATSDVDTGSHR